MANSGKSKKTASSAKNFRKRVKGIPLELPSGETALVRRPGMDKIMNSGVMPDSLTPIAMKQIEKGDKGRLPKDEDVDKELMKTVLNDPEKVSEIFGAFDKITALCVVEPKCRLHYYTDEDARTGLLPEGASVGDEIDEEDRDEDLLYTDEVDSADKMFIFNFAVGGSADLESFRKQLGQGVESLGAE